MANPFRKEVKNALPNFALPTAAETVSPENEALQLEIFNQTYKELREFACPAMEPDFYRLFWSEHALTSKKSSKAEAEGGPKRPSIFDGFDLARELKLGTTLQRLAEYAEHDLVYKIGNQVVSIISSLAQAKNVRKRVVRDMELLDTMPSFSYDLALIAMGLYVGIEEGTLKISASDADQAVIISKNVLDLFLVHAMEDRLF